MKKLAITLALALTFTATPAHAEDVGGWALLDENNNVLGVHVCAASVCGDPNSEFSKNYLQPGQHYALQTKADQQTGNVAGWNNATYTPETNTFTIPVADPYNGTIIGGSYIEEAVFPQLKAKDENYGITWKAREGATWDNTNTYIPIEDVIPIIKKATLKTKPKAKVKAKAKKKVKR
jgi:hypothetical protein